MDLLKANIFLYKKTRHKKTRQIIIPDAIFCNESMNRAKKVTSFLKSSSLYLSSVFHSKLFLISVSLEHVKLLFCINNFFLSPHAFSVFWLNTEIAVAKGWKCIYRKQD